MQIGRECLPEVAGGLQGKDGVLRIAVREDFRDVLPQDSLKTIRAHGERKRLAELHPIGLDDSNLVPALGGVDTDNDLSFEQLSLLLQSFLVHDVVSMRCLIMVDSAEDAEPFQQLQHRPPAGLIATGPCLR
jgi:hypothetical protein